MVTQGANVRRGVLVASSLILTLQLLALATSIVAFFFASSEEYRDKVAKAVITQLYHPQHWKWLRRTRALELLLLLPTVLMLVGASKRLRFLLLPWLIIFGVFQLALFAAVFICVINVHSHYVQVMSAASLVLVEAFIIFPWWFAVLHLFAVFTHMEDIKSAEILMAAVQEATAAADAATGSNSAAHSWRYDGAATSSCVTKMSEV